MSVKNCNLVFHVLNGTSNKIVRSIEYDDLFEDVYINYSLTVGDFLLLKSVKDILIGGNNVIINSGYKG